MSMSREEQLKILGQMKESDLDYSDIPVTDAQFWQKATINPHNVGLQLGAVWENQTLSIPLS